VIAVQLPSFPETSHPTIQALFQKTDPDLVNLYQRHPEMGQYFAAIFCRYAQVVYTLIASATRSPVQSDYLFVRTWEYIFNELRSLDLRAMQPKLSLQSWLINIAALTINQISPPPPEEINYSLAETSPVFWCYLNQTLNLLPGNLRLVAILSQTFRWNHTRIAAYLQAEGETIAAAEVQVLIDQAYARITELLPQDICEIYLSQ
jgi:hypothetical protein